MMTVAEINEELAKLTPAQRRALRKEFPGRPTICFLRCSEFLGKVDSLQVGFVSALRSEAPIYYRVSIGPRGAIRERRCLGR